MRRAAALAVAILAAPGAAFSADAATPAKPAVPVAVQPPSFRASAAPFTDDDQLLVEVTAGKYQLSDGLTAYSSRAGVFLPVGELARALDLAITVYPAEQLAKGWILRESRTVSVDVKSRLIRLGDQTITIGDGEASFHGDDVFLRLDLMQRVLPIDFKFDARGLVLALKPREPLPFEQRLDRENRRLSIGGYTDKVSVLKVDTPYLAITPPSFDLTFNGGGGLLAPHVIGQYDIRAAGDLGWAAMQLYGSSDQKGRFDDVRLTLGRRDYRARLLGPVRGTEFSVGDTYTPSLALGERGTSGRGAYFSTASLETASVFSHLDLRGELPDGWQVEAYVNEVLRASQTTAVQGRYEFLNLPLSYGANTLRLVFYGPHGEQRQEVRHYTFGSGQLQKGKLAVTLGAVQEGESLIQLPTYGGVATAPVGGQGKLRAAAEVEYGLTNAVTVVGGVSQYTPVTNQTRQVVDLGLRTTLGVFPVQLDFAKDLAGGEGAAVNIAGHFGGLTFLARDNEYRGRFYDETQRAGVGGAFFLSRSSELRLDWVAKVFKVGSGIPMSLAMQRDEKSDGSASITADARFSINPFGAIVSSALAYSRHDGPSTKSTNTMSGSLEASRLIGDGWQFRAGLQYVVLPNPIANSVFVNLDRSLSSRNTLRLSLGQSLTSGYSTSVQIADTLKFRRASVSLATSYDSQRHDARVGVQVSFGLVFDQTHGRYRVVRPGATSGGDAAFVAFIDSNGDGKRERGEPAVANLPLDSQGGPVKTDANGQALITGLGGGSSTRIRVKTDSLDEPYTVPPADVVEFSPRAGRVTTVLYGLKPVGEAELKLLLHKPGGEKKGVSGLVVQLLSEKNVVVAQGKTEYDGTMFLEKLPPGAYKVRIEPEQSKRLGLDIGPGVMVKIPAQGGYVGNIEGEVVVR